MGEREQRDFRWRVLRNSNKEVSDLADTVAESEERGEDQVVPEADELDGCRARVRELEGLAAQQERELGLAQGRIGEMEQAVAEKENSLATLQQSVAVLEERLAAADGSLTQAVARYRALVVATHPAVPAELITGDTIEAIDEALETAESLVERVKQELATEIASARVPTGAPPRMPLDLSGLSTREKIQYAIGGK